MKIEATFSPDGTVEVKVSGVKGPACKDASAFLERALGGRAVRTERTPEWNEGSQERGRAQAR